MLTKNILKIILKQGGLNFSKITEKNQCLSVKVVTCQPLLLVHDLLHKGVCGNSQLESAGF